ncbi:MAG: DUF4340 domain-containing protein [Candidatus Marinimicrobia bacterium]|nr:DUF4340 domain-containing protein [Candidatus Neomarinimicrobiota bacterium]
MTKHIHWIRYTVVLVTAILVLWIVQSREKQFESQEVPVFDFDPELVTSFQIRKGTDSLAFALEDTLWVFQEPDTGKVDQQKVHDFLKTITDMSHGTYIASNPEYYPEYHLDEASATHLILKKGDETLGDILVGWSDASPVKDNMRYPHDPHVYQLDLKLTRHLRTQAGFWRE